MERRRRVTLVLPSSMIPRIRCEVEKMILAGLIHSVSPIPQNMVLIMKIYLHYCTLMVVDRDANMQANRTPIPILALSIFCNY